MAYNPKYSKNNNNRNNNYSNNGRPHQGTGYIGAPYNFVPFCSEVQEYPKEQLPAHNKVTDELYDGEINYIITAQTPIMVDSGKGVFYRNPYGEYAIPGSSMRGLIRNNVQILSLSGIGDDVDDYALMFRNVTNTKKKNELDRYNDILGSKSITVNNGDKSQQVSVLTNVRAGYVKNENGTYRIYDTILDQVKKEFGYMNYYILSERKVVNAYQAYQKSGRKKFEYAFFIKKGNILQHDINVPFRKEFSKGRNRYIGEKNGGYKPYAKACSYELSDRDVTAVGFPGEYSHEGFAVSTGRMNDKKAIYIIPQIADDKVLRFDGETMPITISETDEKAFRYDLNKRSTTLKTFGGKGHFDLPENGKTKPIFYIKLDGRLYFGFTPRLRLFYDHTIKEGMSDSHKEGMLDYAKAMFGYSTDDDSYKSRVSFADAVVIKQVSDKLQEVRYIQGEPKPTSYLDYLQPKNGKGVSYNAGSFELRGVKQYWLRKAALPTNVPAGKEKQPYVTRFSPLPAKTQFIGKVRFHNLNKEELGLLLWAIKLDGKSWMNIGKAKSFGYGNIKVDVDSVKVLDAEKAYQTEVLILDPYRDVEPEEYIKAYKDGMSQKLGGKKIEDQNSIKVFFMMKNPEIAPKKDDIRYMDLKEYQSREKALPTAEDILKKKS